MTNNQIKYLRTLQKSYNKGLIDKKEWKKERKFVRNLTSVKNPMFHKN